MANFVRRRIYTRATPPAAANIDGFLSILVSWLDDDWPDLEWDEIWTLVVDEIVDAATAGGFWPAWGRGDPAWDEIPDDDVTGEVALEDALGIFPGTMVYVEPDVAGAITMRGGSRWTIAAGQTPYMLIEAPYTGAHEPTAAIREVGLYIGAEPEAGHEADAYLPLANVADLGDYQAVDRMPIVNRSPTTSGKVRFLISVED